MTAIVLVFVLLAVALGSQTQTVTPAPVPLSILGYKWTRARRSQGSAGDQEQKAKEAATNQQAALAGRDFEGTGTPSGEAQELGERKQSQIALLPLPGEAVKGYLYKVQVRNVADKIIRKVLWSYGFADVLTQKDIVRYQFYSRTRIRPGHEKSLSVFARAAPPRVINVKELSKNGGKPWNETVVIDRVEYTDGTTWARPATAGQVKPANN